MLQHLRKDSHTRSMIWLARHALALVGPTRPLHHLVKMLRIRMLSGDALTSIPLKEVQDVRCVKLHLHRLHGCPSRFRQRLLLHGERLADAVKLESTMELDLVLLTFVESSQEQVDALVTAARLGSLVEVGKSETAYVVCPWKPS